MNLRRSALPSLLVLAGCSAGSDVQRQPVRDTVAAVAAADTTASGPKACDLVSNEDLARITGGKFEKGVTTDDYMGSSKCRFARTGDPQGGAIVALHQHGELKNYRNVPGSSTVKSVGDSAVWNGTTAQLAVQTGTAVFSIAVFFPPGTQSASVQLARIALTKLAQP